MKKLANKIVHDLSKHCHALSLSFCEKGIKRDLKLTDLSYSKEIGENLRQMKDGN